MDHVICAIDSPRSHLWEEAEDRIKNRFPELKPEFLYQSRLQSIVLRIIDWGWVDAWLSFCKCIAAAKTQFIILNDNDAMLLDQNLVENRYQTIVERGDHFVGISWSPWNGLEKSDHILYTVNMAFDAQFVRSNCHPIECFNDVRILNGKTVDLDILHQCQLKTEKRSVLPISNQQMVHPSQVISQFSYLARGKGYVPPARNNLFFIPYFEYLGGKSNILDEQTLLLEDSQSTHISFLGHSMNMVNLTTGHLRWIREQIERVEQNLYGQIRPEVEHYLKAIEAHIVSPVTEESSVLSS